VRDTTNRSISTKAVQDECAALYNVAIGVMINWYMQEILKNFFKDEIDLVLNGTIAFDVRVKVFIRYIFQVIFQFKKKNLVFLEMHG